MTTFYRGSSSNSTANKLMGPQDWVLLLRHVLNKDVDTIELFSHVNTKPSTISQHDVAGLHALDLQEPALPPKLLATANALQKEAIAYTNSLPHSSLRVEFTLCGYIGAWLQYQTPIIALRNPQRVWELNMGDRDLHSTQRPVLATDRDNIEVPELPENPSPVPAQLSTQPDAFPDRHAWESQAAYQRGRADALLEALRMIPKESPDRTRFLQRAHDETNPFRGYYNNACTKIRALENQIVSLESQLECAKRSLQRANETNPFRGYYNNACAKIVSLESQLANLERRLQQIHESQALKMALFLERIALFSYQAASGFELAGEIRRGQWHRISEQRAQESLDMSGRLAEVLDMFRRETP